MNVSANTVFHFTRSFDNLVGILRNEFKPRYNFEDLSEVFPSIPLHQTYIPMTCFCDIPLSALSKHAKKYGRYAIGLTKEWAEKKGLNPILYLRKESRATQYVKNLLVGFRKNVQSISDPSFVQSFYELVSHFKAYENYPSRTAVKKIFYDEREWRYVPRIPAEDSCSRLSKADYGNDTVRRKAERRLDANYRLGFAPNDIRYLVVSDESEVLKLAKKIPTIKGRYSADDRIVLMTKIKSFESLLEDL